MYDVLKKEIDIFESQIDNPKVKTLFHNCFYNTLDTTITYLHNGDVYVLTGDIPAMWLRDSSACVMQYIDFAKDDEDIRKLILGLLNRDYFYIGVDPYANSFNKDPNGYGFTEDEGLRTPYTWERKFEIDSLCYPIWIAYKLFKVTGDKKVISKEFVKACRIIIDVFRTEQDHDEKSKYYHYRPGEKEVFCIPNHGHGGKYKRTGLIWSGYRPSDDACKYSFFIPGNMFATVILKDMAEMLELVDEKSLVSEALSLRQEIEEGIQKYGIIHTEKYGDVYAYEVDGLGNYLLIDDANIPSLLSVPYFGYRSSEDPIYKNTRNFVLSFDNPYYYEGKVISGIGSIHTPKDYVWHIGVTLQGLTSSNENEKRRMLDMLIKSDDGTNYMHEGVHKDDASQYTRSWFAWANSFFAYFILRNKQIVIKGE